MLLLHGIRVTADANWFTSYPALTERYGVVAIDHRGHGRGIRADRAVRLADCADDAVAALDVLGIEQAIAVGYSMGGPIAQLVWHRHRERTAGLVLCATAHRFRGVEPVLELGPMLLQRLRATAEAPAKRGRVDREVRAWLASELALTDRRGVMEAGALAGPLRQLAVDRRGRRAARGGRHDQGRGGDPGPPAPPRRRPAEPVGPRGRRRPRRLRRPTGRSSSPR